MSAGPLALLLVVAGAATPATAAEPPNPIASPAAASAPSVAAPAEVPPATSSQTAPPEPTAPPSATPPQPPPPPAPAHPLAPAPPQVNDDEELRALVDESAPPRSRLNTAAWIGSGVTVLLLGTAAFFGAKASEKNGDVNRLLGNFDEKTGVPTEYAQVASQYEQAISDGRHDDRMAKGFAVAAGVAAVASVVLFVVDAVRAPAAEPKGPLSSAPAARRTGAASGGNLGLSWVF